MPDLDDMAVLNAMILDSARVSVVEGKYGKPQVVLIESQETKNLTIEGIPKNAIVIKADTFPAPKAIFQGEKSECKRADYMIVAETDKKKWIVCIEMSVGIKQEKEVIAQLSGAACVMRYCQAIGEYFWDKKNFLKDFEYRFVSIDRIGVQKRSTRHKNSNETHHRPEKMLKISAPNRLEFNKLAGSA